MMRKFRNDQRGTVAVMVAVLAPILIGGMAISVEATNWMLVTSAAQGVASAAAVSAAMNPDNFTSEALAVGAKHGYPDGIAVVKSACGDGDCIKVTVTKSVPLLMSQIMGVVGDGAGHKVLSAMAVARIGDTTKLCVVANTISGSASGNMGGCSTLANVSASCDEALGIGVSFSTGVNLRCGSSRVHADALGDPYAYLSGNIGNSACTDYTAKLITSLPSGDVTLCGDVKLGADVALAGTLIIENGKLDLNGWSFIGDGSLVFTGSKVGAKHTVTDSTGTGGAIDINAPTSGAWKGVAIYSPDGDTLAMASTWRVSGLIEMPRAAVTLTTSIAKATSGKGCLVLVSDSFNVSGAGGVLSSAQGQCDLAGLAMPAVKFGRVALVQ